METRREPLELVDSFRDCWQTFRKQCQRLIGDSRFTPEEEEEFLKTREALLERYQRIQESPLGSNLPEGLTECLARLDEIEKVSTLSDRQLDGFKEAARSCEGEIESWLESLRRKDLFKESLLKKKRKEGILQYLTVPVAFIALSALLLFLGIRFYLNR